MPSRRAQLGGVHAGGGPGGAVVHLDLPAAPSSARVVDPAERHARQIERVALLTIPELLRFDVHPRADTFSFNVRQLNGLPVRDNAHELPVRPYHRPDGPPLNEYELQLKTPEGYDVCIVVRVPPYFGALENDYSAVALLR
jgi:hypothetical protein